MLEARLLLTKQGSKERSVANFANNLLELEMGFNFIGGKQKSDPFYSLIFRHEWSFSYFEPFYTNTNNAKAAFNRKPQCSGCVAALITGNTQM